MDFNIKNGNNSFSIGKNALPVQKPYIPSMHAQTKDTVSFGSKKDDNPVRHYTEEERQKICENRRLSRHIVSHITKLDDRQFEQALKALDKGYFNSEQQPVALTLENFASSDEETFKKSMDFLDKYKEKGVDLSLIYCLDIPEVVNLDEDNREKAVRIIDLIRPETSPQVFIDASMLPASFVGRTSSDEHFERCYTVIKKCLDSDLPLPHSRTLTKITAGDENTNKKFNEFIDECIAHKKPFYTERENTLNILRLEDQNFEQAKKLVSKIKPETNIYYLLTLAMLDEREFGQAEKMLERGVKDTEVEYIAALPEKQFKNAQKLLDRGDLSPYVIRDISYLEDYQLARVDELLKSGIRAGCIAKIGALEPEQYSRVFERGMPGKYYAGAIAGLAQFDDDVWAMMEEKGMLEKFTEASAKHDEKGYLIITDAMDFDAKQAAKLQNVCRYAIEIKDLGDKTEVSELTSKEKRNLLRSLITANADIFGKSNIIKKLVENSAFMPYCKEEYCSLLKQISNSIGISSKPLSNETKQEFFKALNSLDAKDGDFRKFDFTAPGLKIGLSYPREDFISDVSKSLSNESEKDKSLICNYFGFELKTSEKAGTILNGYPFVPDEDIEIEALKAKAEEIKPLVQRFTENNTVTVPGSEEISKQLTSITKAFPEFMTEIGKKQHKTHDYTLDIHSLKVLQGVINNPAYETLPPEDKTALKISALFHDITKQEGMIDKTHPFESAFDTYYLLGKLDMSEDDKYKIYHTVKNHNWLERYDADKVIDGKKVPSTPEERAQRAKEIAFELRKGNSFEAASILTEADLKSVTRDNTFFDRFATAFIEGKKEVGGFVKQIKETALCLPQAKIPKADEIKIDNVHTKKTVNRTKDGKTFQNTYVYLEKGLDLGQFGFEDGLIADDLNVLVHGLDKDEQSAIFQVLGRIDSDALLSTSYVNYGQDNYYVFRPSGFVLEVDSDDINAGYFKDFGSGYKKDVNLLVNKYLYDGSRNKYRTYISDLIKNEMNLTGEEYAELYKQIANKSISQIDKINPETAKSMRNVIGNIENGKRAHGREYNEMLVSRPKIKAVFNYGDENIPDFLLKYASDNNLPVICFGK